MSSTFRSYCRLCGHVHGKTMEIGGVSADCPVTAEGIERCRYCGRPEDQHPPHGHDFQHWPDEVLPIRGKFGGKENGTIDG